MTPLTVVNVWEKYLPVWWKNRRMTYLIAVKVWEKLPIPDC
jgi:hypothetical protein